MGNLHFEQSEPPYPLLQTQVSGATQVPCTHCCAHTGTHVLPFELRVYPWQHTLTVRTLEIIWNKNKKCVTGVADIRDVYPGSRIGIFSITNPDFFSSRNPDSHLSILTQKNFSKLSETLSGLFILIPDPDFLPIPDRGSRGQKGTGSRIPDPQHCLLPLSVGREQCPARLRYFQLTRKIHHSG